MTTLHNYIEQNYERVASMYESEYKPYYKSNMDIDNFLNLMDGWHEQIIDHCTNMWREELMDEQFDQEQYTKQKNKIRKHCATLLGLKPESDMLTRVRSINDTMNKNWG